MKPKSTGGFRFDVAIVGGGISGLAAAHFLERHRPDIAVTVLEASPRLGGIIRTERTNGYVIEAGPDSFLSSKPRGIGLAEELGITASLQGTNELRQRTWVMGDGTLHPLPEGFSGLVPSRLGPLLDSDLFTATGKAQLRQEPAIPPKSGDEDESLASFIERRFGAEVYDRMIEPLMAGIYAGDGRELSLAATFPQLRRLEIDYGSVIRGITATTHSSDQPRRSAFLTLEDGMEALVEAVVRRLNRVSLSCGAEVALLHRTNSGYRLGLTDGREMHTRAAILATPAPVTARLLSSLGFAHANTSAEIPMASTATVSLAYRAASVPRTKEGYGYVVPRREGRPVLASTWVSTKFAHRAPPGHALIRIFIGRRGADDMLSGRDADLIEIARNEVESTLKTRDTPVLQRVFRWPDAMPQYVLGHCERIERMQRDLRDVSGLYVAGNWIAGVGVPDCIASGEVAAEEAVTYLGTINSHIHGGLQEDVHV